PKKIEESLDQFKFREALTNMMELARVGNKYLADTEPWKLIKEDESRVGTILNIALQIAANLSILCEPFLPFTSKKLNGILNVEEGKWSDAGSVHLLEDAHQMNKAELLFEKIEDDVVEAQVSKLLETKKMNEEENNAPELTPLKDEIVFDDFVKMDLRVGEIKTAEAVEKSNKLLKFTVDVGLETRTILSGVSKHFTIEEMIGKKVVVMVNLPARKMMGTESEGMLLFAENADGKLVAVNPGDEAENGAVIA
ncbi:MAG: methionine--tRNA ligase subunit beta, partial [Cyclobacteriaceae bacterium]